MRERGFTLIEVIVVMTLFALLSTFATINLLRPQTKISLDTTVSTLVADIKQQQLKSMVGESGSAALATTFGLYFEPTRYILFPGSSYNPVNPDNFVVDLDNNMVLSNILFPSQTIVFSRMSGEVVGFSPGSNSVVARNNNSGEQKTVTINRYGAIIIN